MTSKIAPHPQTVHVLSRTAFCVSDRSGDIHGSGEMGHFHRDTRHLSEYVLTVNCENPSLLSSHGSGEKEAAFFLTAEPSLSIMRKRNLPPYSGGLEEEIKVTNHAPDDAEVTLELRLSADFADIFEVRGGVEGRQRNIRRHTTPDTLTFSYERDDFRRETRITIETDGDSNGGSDAGIEANASGFIVILKLPSRAESRVKVRLHIPQDGGILSEVTSGKPSETPSFPRLHTGNDDLRRLWERSVGDLHSLRFQPDAERLEVYAAGVPWYMALFGRDSLITCYQTLPLGPERTMDTLRLLAKYQGKEANAFRDEEPGKILHELRLGEAAHFEDVPHSPYYGTADATSLFLIVLHELWRWTGNDDFIREMEPPARRALDWLGLRADPYIDYSPNPAGLVNHGWKDSKDSSRFADGKIAEPPIAPCEVQGYTYDAYTRMAELAEEVWGDADLAAGLRSRARKLATRFDRDFWMEEQNCYALALDGNGRHIDSITSNAGHLLWSGIVPEDRATRLARTLMAPTSFSGWGIRTMATANGGYDPVSYHNGSVWPHDNSLIAHGLARYGFRDEANRIAMGLVEASSHFDYRLPEVFAGYDRVETGYPVEYPTACSPQAWAAGSGILLVRTILGLEPEHGKLVVDPVLPDGISRLGIEAVPAFGTLHDVGTD